MSLLNVEKLTHGFGDKTLLKNISFRLLKGEHVGLIGANGVGKTTFLNLLTGKQLPNEGIIQWASSIKIGYLDQHSDLEPEHSVRNILKSAFQELYEIEKEIWRIGEGLAFKNNKEIEKDLKRMGELQEKLERSNFYSIDSYIENVANGLGLDAFGLETYVGKLSGGQRTKVLLAKLLLESPDILLLDEPTNYLDKEHIEWLCGYLSKYANSFILISHDTHFLNRVVNVIYHIEFTGMKRYPGDYNKFLYLKEQERQRYMEEYRKQQQEIKRMEEFVQKNIVRATTSTRAKSRQKQLNKIERLEKPQIAAKPSFSFSIAREPGRLIFQSSKLKIGYNFPLLHSLDMKLERGEKIAIVGCNGIGKSTLLKTIMGLVPAIGGQLDFGDYIFPAYYEQEVTMKRSLTALEEVWSDFPKLTQPEVRRALARCGLKEEHIRQGISSLSGGEQSKVRLCKLMLTPSNWLLLDEPTNHLDTEAKHILKESLVQYQGTIVLVCHEKEFFQDWATGVWDMEKYLMV